MNNAVIVNLVLGILLLFLGRKLFWLFVGVAGFLLGMHYASYIAARSEGSRLLIALAAGIIGAVLAILLQKIAIAVAGFIIGAYLGVELLHLAISAPASWNWAAYIIGGIIGALLILVLFDWALIILSSLSGASLIVHNVAIHAGASQLLYVGLVIVGILVQAGIMRSTRSVIA